MRRCLMIGLTAALVENALVTRQGAWVLLAVCPNTEEARAAFEGSFTRTEVRPSPTPRPIPPRTSWAASPATRRGRRT